MEPISPDTDRDRVAARGSNGYTHSRGGMGSGSIRSDSAPGEQQRVNEWTATSAARRTFKRSREGSNIPKQAGPRRSIENRYNAIHSEYKQARSVSCCPLPRFRVEREPW